MKLLLLAALCALAPAAAAQTLPPDHPPIARPAPSADNGSLGAQALPPDHPPIAAPASPAEPGALKDEAALIAELDATPGLKTQKKPFEVALSLGKLYYSNGRFADAVIFLDQAVKAGEEARAMFLSLRAKAKARKLDLPSAAASGCPAGEKTSLQARLDAVKAQARAGKTGEAATCARVALGPVLEARRLLCGAQFNTGDPAGALASAEAVLEADPNDADALYLRGSLLLDGHGDDPAKLRQAKADFEAWARLRPGERQGAWVRRLIAHIDRALAAGGVTKMYEMAAPKRGASPVAVAPSPGGAAGPAAPLAPVSPEAMEAIRNTEVTPEMKAGLTRLIEEAEGHLAQGRFEDALANYRRVVPFDPKNGRAVAGMAWSMVGMGRRGADRVWSVAVRQDPAAVDALGKALEAKGDADGAKALWTRLAKTDPGYAQKSGLARRLSP